MMDWRARDAICRFPVAGRRKRSRLPHEAVAALARMHSCGCLAISARHIVTAPSAMPLYAELSWPRPAILLQPLSLVLLAGQPWRSLVCNPCSDSAVSAGEITGKRVHWLDLPAQFPIG